MTEGCRCDVIGHGHYYGCRYYGQWKIAQLQRLRHIVYICHNVTCIHYNHPCLDCRPDYEGMIKAIQEEEENKNRDPRY